MATVYGNYRYFDSGNGWWRTKVDYSGSSATVGIEVKQYYTVWVRITGSVNGVANSNLNYSSSATSSATIGTVSIDPYSSNTINLNCTGGTWGQNGDSTATVPKQSTPSAPTCSVSITNIGVDRATCTGQITNNPSNYWRIHLYNTNGTWQTYDTGTSPCSFTQTGLAHNTTYNFYHQYTNQSDGEGSGLIAHSFTTSGNAPVINSCTPDPSRTSCSLANNSISYDTNASLSSVSTQYGTTTSYGSTVASSNITGLTPNTTYYYSMTVTDNFGRTSNAATGSFKTTGNAPSISRVLAEPTRTGCVLTISAYYDTGASYYSKRIDYGTTTDYGSSISGGSSGTRATLSSLTPNTTYYYKVVVQDNYYRSSTAYTGSFTTTGNAPTISDVSGNVTETTYGFTYTATYDTNASYSSIRNEWGTTTSYGSYNTTNAISGLQPGTHYYHRFRVTDNFGRTSDWYTDEFTTLTSTTLKIKVNGVWKDATPYVNVNGTWKKAEAYMNVNGIWKQGKS